MSELHHLTIAEAADLIATRKLSPVEYVQALFAHVGTFGPQVCAFITQTSEQALARASEAEREIARGRHRGPLHGIPFGLKDVFDTARSPSTTPVRSRGPRRIARSCCRRSRVTIRGTRRAFCNRSPTTAPRSTATSAACASA